MAEDYESSLSNAEFASYLSTVNQGAARADNEILDALSQLQESVASMEQIQSMKAVSIVSKMRVHANEQIQTLAERVVTKWKMLMPQPPTLGGRPSLLPEMDDAATIGRKRTIEETSVAIDTSGGPGVTKRASMVMPEMKKNPNRSLVAPSASAARPKALPGSAKDRVVQLLADAMTEGLEKVPEDQRPEGLGPTIEVAKEIELQMAKTQQGKEYAAKNRSLVFNLKRNAGLVVRLLFGEVSAAELIQMPPEDLANEELQALREEWRKKKMTESTTLKAEETTDMFRCGRCRERKCTYYQKQTRSADEPMTTFVTCVNCGNRWRF